MKLATAEFDSPLGTILIAVRDGLLCALEYGDDRLRMETLLARRFGEPEFEPAANPARVVERVLAYLRGDLEALRDVRVDAGGTPLEELAHHKLAFVVGVLVDVDAADFGGLAESAERISGAVLPRRSPAEFLCEERNC